MSEIHQRNQISLRKKSTVHRRGNLKTRSCKEKPSLSVAKRRERSSDSYDEGVDEVERRGVAHVGLEALAQAPLVLVVLGVGLDELGVQLQLLHARPHLGHDAAAHLHDQRQLVLLGRALKRHNQTRLGSDQWVSTCMMGLRVHSSAMMQPAPQMSMAGV